MYKTNLSITELTAAILEQMEVSGFAQSTRGFYITLFHRLCRMAKERGEEYYTTELGYDFINDTSHIIPENTKRYYHERTIAYTRCIKLVETFLATGQADWSPALRSACFPIKASALKKCFDAFENELVKKGLKPNTIDGYRRFTYYFIEFLESKGYTDISDIRNGDVLAFLTVICSEKYQPTSLCAHMPGLKIFLGMNPVTDCFLCEIPEHLPKKREILKVYSDEEYKKIINHLDSSNDISFRNKAITVLALNTGLRAVDICGLQLHNIDWKHNCIHIIQEKTGYDHAIPISDAIGNALVDYLLNERPVTDSSFVFLSSVAPFHPLMSHSGIRGVLFNVVNDSDIEPDGRVYGTRITRHSAASRMLRSGIPLPVISDMLGHKSKDSVMIYITTDDAKLAECTLSLPKVGDYNE